jgi:hypothetical protein
MFVLAHNGTSFIPCEKKEASCIPLVQKRRISIFLWDSPILCGNLLRRKPPFFYRFDLATLYRTGRHSWGGTANSMNNTCSRFGSALFLEGDSREGRGPKDGAEMKAEEISAAGPSHLPSCTCSSLPDLVRFPAKTHLPPAPPPSQITHRPHGPYQGFVLGPYCFILLL